MGIIPDIETIIALHKRYASFAKADLFDLVFTHCQIVCEIAMQCADNTDEPVDREILRAAALLHDIGSYPFFDEQGHTDGYGFYPMHALLGARLIADEGFDARIAEAVENHLLLGLSKREIAANTSRVWPLPRHDYLPKSIEAEIVCYADRFHSKQPVFNGYESFLQRLEFDMPDQAAAFKADAKRFGVPDVAALAQKYNQKIR